MSAGMNVARPATAIDLETVRRNLREVMTNLRLLENGANVRVEDLIRQARENLDRNRRFILRIGQNEENRNIANVRNAVERIPVIHPVPLAAEEEQQLERINPENNAEEQVDGDQRNDEERNVPGNGDNNPVQHMANQVREWAERYERDWNQFRQNLENDDGNVVQNVQVNPVERNIPTVVHRRVPGGGANNDAEPVRINRNNNINNAEPVRINRNNNINNVARARPANYELPRCLLGAIRRRPAGVPGGPNIYPMPGRCYNAQHALGMRAPRPPPPPPRANRFALHPRQIVPNQRGTLEERIAFLQDRLDRLEDRRFYEYMIEEGGHERIRDMIGRLRRRLQQENVANAHANLYAHYHHRRNRPGAEANQDGAGQLMPPPARRDVQQCFVTVVPPPDEEPPEQTIPRHNPAVKRQNIARTSRETNAEQVSTPKRRKVEENLPGRSCDPEPLPSQRNNDNAVAGPSNNGKNSLDVGSGSAQIVPENIHIMGCQETNEQTPYGTDANTHEAKDKGKRLKKHKKKDHSKKDKKKKNRPENNPDDQLPGTSREIIDLRINRDTVENYIEDREDNDITERPEVENLAEDLQTAENVPDGNQENQQDPNADVIIVSAFFPVRIKVEKNDDDNNGNNGPNNPLNQGNAAQNRANPPVIPQNYNGARQERRRVIRPAGAPRRVENGIHRAFRELPVPILPAEVPRGVEGAIIEVPELAIRDEAGIARILNYARAVMNANAGVRGPDLGLLDRPFLTLENMVAGLQHFITNEVREGNRRPEQVQANETEENQLLMIQTYVRLRRELREVIFNSERLGIRGYKIGFLNGQIILWFRIVGPPGTAYDRAEVSIRIRVNISQLRQYSDVRMAQRTWHPNMCPFTGNVLAVYPWNNWTLFKILACVRRLLIIPELENTTHDVVAKQYRTNREIFNRTAQHWTSVYGRGGRNDNLAIPEYAELLERLVEEGIPKDRALHLLSKNNWDIDKAMEEVG